MSLICTMLTTSNLYSSDESFLNFKIDEAYQEDAKDRSVIWGPMLSYIFPGSHQLYSGQYLQGSFYMGLNFLGHIYKRGSGFDFNRYQEDLYEFPEDNHARNYIFGAGISSLSSSLSAYASFQTTILYNKEKFDFIQKQESIKELSLAPFDFSYIKRPTTYIPLAIALVVSAFQVQPKDLTGSDMFFTSAFSYQAGVGEEALFRGYMLPALYSQSKDYILSNTITTLSFALAHGIEPVPWIQALVGYYLGEITYRNNWSIKESIFIHTWWDVIAFTAHYLSRSKEEKTLYLPLLRTAF